MLLLGAGCAPKIPKSPAAVVVAQQPVALQVSVDASMPVPELQILLLAGGSRWDPPGQEGRAWVLSHAVAVPDKLDVWVDRDHAWWTLPCSPAQSPTCAEVLAIALQGSEIPAGALDEAQQALSDPPTDQVLVDVWYGLTFEAHPYGHPVTGRIGALEAASGSLPAWSSARAENWAKPTIRAKLSGADAAHLQALAEQIRPVLQRFPAAPIPDSAMKGPPTPRAPTLAIVPIAGEQAFVLAGIALPRRATQTTRLLPTPADLAARELAVRCLAATLGPQMSPDLQPQAPPGWPSTLSAPKHAPLLWRSTGSSADMRTLATSLLQGAVAPDQGAPQNGCADLPVEVENALANLIVVVGWPNNEDLPSWRVSPNVELIDLPPATQGLFR